MGEAEIPMPSRSVRFLVPKDAAGSRLDVVLARLQPGMSRRAARKLIDQGSVFVTGKRIRVLSRTVDAGDEIIVALDDADAPVVPALPDAAVLAVEDAFVVVDKPAGVPTEPTRTRATGALTVELKALLRARGLDTTFLAAAHRLDVDTSGLVVVARTKSCAGQLGDQFRDGVVERKYLALVVGEPREDHFDVHATLSKPDAYGTVHVDERGQKAHTRLRVLARSSPGGQGALLIAEAVTGRTHQLRVHLAHIGHALAGDTRYGSPAATAPHLGLHATALAFDREDGTRARFVAMPPAAFVEAAVALGLTAADVERAAAGLAVEEPAPPRRPDEAGAADDEADDADEGAE